MIWQRKRNSGSWPKGAVRSTIFIPVSGIWSGRPWPGRRSCWPRARTRRRRFWTARRPRSSSSSWRQAPSPSSGRGGWCFCPRWTPPPTATKTSTSCALRWPASKTLWWCWAACLSWNAISSSWASGRRSSSPSAPRSALPRSWPSPSPTS